MAGCLKLSKSIKTRELSEILKTCVNFSHSKPLRRRLTCPTKGRGKAKLTKSFDHLRQRKSLSLLNRVFSCPEKLDFVVVENAFNQTSQKRIKSKTSMSAIVDRDSIKILLNFQIFFLSIVHCFFVIFLFRKSVLCFR